MSLLLVMRWNLVVCACAVQLQICDAEDAMTYAQHCCRRAYELAFASAYMFAGQRPIFKEIDEVTFKRPVDIGDLLRLTSSIVHTQPTSPDSNKVSMTALGTCYVHGCMHINSCCTDEAHIVHILMRQHCMPQSAVAL